MTELVPTRKAYGEALARLGKENQNVVALDADLACSTKSIQFGKEFPERFINIGISEQDMMGTAAGLATCGKIPFASTFAVFSTARALDQVRNSICYPKLNVRIVGSHAGLLTGEDGASHQAIEDMAIMRALPNMSVFVPADSVETNSIMDFLVREFKGPAYLRLSRKGTPVLYDSNYRYKYGKGTILKEGTDLTLVACGSMVHIALQAAETLQKENISARVVNISTLKPLDTDLLVRCANETKGIVTVEDHNIIGGLAGAVAESLSELRPTKIKRVGVMDTYGESGKPNELYQKYGLTAEKIISKAKELL
ncbi:transketolase family protein [Candidatus Woesearchaeota archaeon]|nr:transketolase family protein [Candidatus Woesearchaeota archaeon]